MEPSAELTWVSTQGYFLTFSCLKLQTSEPSNTFLVKSSSIFLFCLKKATIFIHNRDSSLSSWILKCSVSKEEKVKDYPWVRPVSWNSSQLSNWVDKCHSKFEEKIILYWSRRFDTSINIEWNLSIITYYELLVIGRFQGQGMRSSGLRIPPRSWPWYCLFVGRERKCQCRRFTGLFNINWNNVTIKNQNTFNLVLSICFQYYSFYCLGQKLLRS